MPEDWFGEDVAARYDESASGMFAPDVVEPAVDFLVELAGDGAALEFGIGTGRIAIPLVARGVRVKGIDLSEAMLARLRDKPEANDIEAVAGDFSATQVEGAFSLVYVVWNTINNLVTQEAQVACFRNAASHLHEGGAFVVEVGVPQLQRVPPGETLQPFHVGESHVGLDEYDLVGQGLVSHHFSLDGDGRWERRSIPFRYVWPAELDLMAQLAGMELRERWEDWRRTPFTSASRGHVSVWVKP